jgi:hypothetical protein
MLSEYILAQAAIIPARSLDSSATLGRMLSGTIMNHSAMNKHYLQGHI